ncbi:hypothetical protein T484DRAFT_1768379 [Baffinella frigidus]|nr:hypothetical protein T484DRAFT_1768379 [Cryptophyta sp. CCMP2293]
MQHYYAHWEKLIFKALTLCVYSALDQFGVYLNIARKSASQAHSPIVRVTASLSAPDIVLSPAKTDIKKLFSKMVKNTVESTKSFHRWMRGTCLECAPQYVNGDEDEAVIFSFYSDISEDPNVMKRMFTLDQAVEKAFDSMTAVEKAFDSMTVFLDKWKRYSTLWKHDKHSMLDKFVKSNPTYVDYESKLSYYKKMKAQVKNDRPMTDIDFIQVSCHPLIQDLNREVDSWMHVIGKTMHDNAKTQVIALNDSIQDRKEKLFQLPEDLEALKAVIALNDSIQDRKEKLFQLPVHPKP